MLIELVPPVYTGMDGLVLVDALELAVAFNALKAAPKGVFSAAGADVIRKPCSS